MKNIHNVKMSNFKYYCWKIKNSNIFPEDWEEIVFDDELTIYEKICLIRLAHNEIIGKI